MSKEDYTLDEVKKQIEKQNELENQIKNQFKSKSIINKEEAIIFFNELTNGKELYYAYIYSISNELKTDVDIYNYLINKFLFTENDDFRAYFRSFVHAYGEACGSSSDDIKINQALNVVKKLISQSSIHAYWLFYSLNGEYKIPFEKYYEMYKLFENDIEVQSFLLLDYKNDIRKAPEEGEMLSLLYASSDECIKRYYYCAVGYNFFSSALYDYLVQRGVESYKLDKIYDSYQKNCQRQKEEEVKTIRRKRCFFKRYKKKYM